MYLKTKNNTTWTEKQLFFFFSSFYWYKVQCCIYSNTFCNTLNRLCDWVLAYLRFHVYILSLWVCVQRAPGSSQLIVACVGEEQSCFKTICSTEYFSGGLSLWWINARHRQAARRKLWAGLFRKKKKKFLQFVLCTMGSVLHTRPPFFLPPPSKSRGAALVHGLQTMFTMKMFSVCVSNFTLHGWIIKGVTASFSDDDCSDHIRIPQGWWVISNYTQVWLEMDLLKKSTAASDEDNFFFFLVITETNTKLAVDLQTMTSVPAGLHLQQSQRRCRGRSYISTPNTEERAGLPSAACVGVYGMLLIHLYTAPEHQCGVLVFSSSPVCGGIPLRLPQHSQCHRLAGGLMAFSDTADETVRVEKLSHCRHKLSLLY